jgi:hypothetical protein
VPDWKNDFMLDNLKKILGNYSDHEMTILVICAGCETTLIIGLNTKWEQFFAWGCLLVLAFCIFNLFASRSRSINKTYQSLILFGQKSEYPNVKRVIFSSLSKTWRTTSLLLIPLWLNTAFCSSIIFLINHGKEIKTLALCISFIALTGLIASFLYFIINIIRTLRPTLFSRNTI